MKDGQRQENPGFTLDFLARKGKEYMFYLIGFSPAILCKENQYTDYWCKN